MKEDTLNVERVKAIVVEDGGEDEDDREETAYLQHLRTKPWLFQPGNRVNPNGRPKGQTMKEWMRKYLAGLTDEERIEYLRGIPKLDLWQMAEGRPTEDKNISITAPTPILGGVVLDEVKDDTTLKSDPKLLS